MFTLSCLSSAIKHRVSKPIYIPTFKNDVSEMPYVQGCQKPSVCKTPVPYESSKANATKQNMPVYIPRAIHTWQLIKGLLIKGS